MSVGENIKRLRKERNFTQKELSRLSGVHEVQIRRYETNKNIMPKVETISRLAKALDVPISTLIEFDTLKKNDKAMKSFIKIAQDEHNELLRSRKIANIIYQLEKLGYKNTITADASIFYDSLSYKIIFDEELLQLEKECNAFLKFKFEELLKQKEEILYKENKD